MANFYHFFKIADFECGSLIQILLQYILLIIETILKKFFVTQFGVVHQYAVKIKIRIMVILLVQSCNSSNNLH